MMSSKVLDGWSVPVGETKLNDGHLDKRSERAREKREYRIMLNVMTVYFLTLGLATMLLPKSFSPFSRRLSPGLSLLGEARRSANEITPFIFMC